MSIRRTPVLVLLLSLLLTTALASVAPVSHADGTPEAEVAQRVTKPSAPRSVKATSTVAAIKVQWRPPARTGGARILGYEVRISASRNGPWSLYDTFRAKARKATVAGLTQGSVLWVRVYATNRKGRGAGSTPVRGMAATTPGAPTGLSYTPSDGAVNLSWNVPFNGGLPITEYIVFQSTDGGTFLAAASAPTNHVTVTGLNAAEHTYLFRVRARNALGDSPFSETLAAVPEGGPGAPTITRAELIDGQLSVTWVLNDLGGGTLDHYTIERRDGGVWSPIPGVTFSGNTGTAALATVHDQDYPLRVTATTEEGTSPPSPVVTIKGALPPNVPNWPVFTTDAESVHAEWSQAAPSDGRPAATGTWARIAETSTCTSLYACSWWTFRPDSADLSGSITWQYSGPEIHPATSYRVQVAACADGGLTYASGVYAPAVNVCAIVSQEATTLAGR